MKRILGLDLGTNSIGWALVKEKENDNEQSSIKRLGVREFILQQTNRVILKRANQLLQMPTVP